MKKFLIAGTMAAMMLPAAGLAQEAVPVAGMQSTADSAGSYTIEVKSQLDVATGSDNVDSSANRNTDPAAIQRTIDANPGLAEKLRAEGVETDRIGAISVQPGGKVVVFKS